MRGEKEKGIKREGVRDGQVRGEKKKGIKRERERERDR